MQKTNTLSKQRGKTTDLVIQAMLVALVFISTIFLNIKLPIASNGGLVHLGTAMLFIASILFGPKKVQLRVLSAWGYLISLADGLFGLQLQLYLELYKGILLEKLLGQMEAVEIALLKISLQRLYPFQ